MKKSNLNKLLKAWNQLDSIYHTLQKIYEEENEKYSSKSQTWQDSEKGEKAGVQLGDIDEASDYVWNAGADIENVLDAHGIDVEK